MKVRTFLETLNVATFLNLIHILGSNQASCNNREQFETFENIICSPSIFMESERESSESKVTNKFQNNTDKNVVIPNEDDDQSMTYTNEVLYDLINKKMSNNDMSTDADGDCNLMISSVNSLNDDTNTDSEGKKSIAGLYLRNPRG